MRHSQRDGISRSILDGRASPRLTLSPRGEAIGESAGPPVSLSDLAAWALEKNAFESTPGDFGEYRNHRRDSAGLRSAKRFFCSSIDRRARAWRAQEPQTPPGEPVLMVPIRYIIYWVTSTSGLPSVTFLGGLPPPKDPESDPSHPSD